jgi:hypothetical protein
MALPSSGSLSLSQIAQELGQPLSNLSLRNLSNSAGKGTPDSMSEFYGYSAGGGGGTGDFFIYIENAAFDDPCSGRFQHIWSNSVDGGYWSTEDGVHFTPYSGFFFVASFQDYETGDWFWETYRVDRGGRLSMLGTTKSQCGPY